MKTKAVVFLALLSSALAVQAGGARVGVVINPGRAFCPPAPICRPVFRSYPTWFGCPPTAFYSWGPSVIVASTGPGSGFSTVSPLMNYTGQQPIYRVPPPVLPAQPVVVHPGSAFRWRN